MSEYTHNPTTLRITSPGKFEGEPRYVPHFYQIWQEGGAYEDRGPYCSIYINAEDVQLFPELHGFYEINLHEDANGFVIAQELLREPPPPPRAGTNTLTTSDIVELSGRYNDGLTTVLEYRNKLVHAILELHENEVDLLAGLITLGWKSQEEPQS